MFVSSYEYCSISKIFVNIFGTFSSFFLYIITAPNKKEKGDYMKIKIKYEITEIEGIKAKTYTKTFGQINQASTTDNFKAFAEGYLSLVNGNGHDINYKIYKANEEEILNGKIQ